MGKKYIIEMKENERLYKAKLDAFNGPVIQEIAGAPYTEPDLEQVRKEAYDEGYADAKGGYENGFENGMIVAWEAAKKIVLDDWDNGIKDDDFYEMFNGKCYRDVLRTFTAAEVIEKLKAYEQEQDAEIKAGDVVYHVECTDIKLWVVDVDHNKIAGIALEEVDGSCDKGDLFKEQHKIKYAKTGQHFEIANVLKKMREES